MDDFDVSEYFREHPERWAGAVGAAGLGALASLMGVMKAKGFLKRTWSLLMVVVQVAVVVGLVRARNSEPVGWE
jgi:ABC-type methionine transport system permease subunit